jgi:hypothetical protein
MIDSCKSVSAAITRVNLSIAALAAVMPAKFGSFDLDNEAVRSKIVPSDRVCIIYFAVTLEVRNCEPQIFSIGAASALPPPRFDLFGQCFYGIEVPGGYINFCPVVGKLPRNCSRNLSGCGEYDGYFVF